MMSCLLRTFFSCFLLANCVLVWTGCNHRGQLVFGDVEASKKAMQPKNNEFESNRLIAASHYIDSAYRTLKTKTVNDYIYYWGTQAYIQSVLGKTGVQLAYLDSAINMLEGYQPRAEIADQLAGFLISKGEAMFALHKYDESYNHFFMATKLAAQYADYCGKMRISYSIAMILYRQQQYDRSAGYFKECLVYEDNCEKVPAYRNNKNQELLDNIGLCYTKMNKPDSALHYYRKALELVQNNRYHLALDTVNSISRYAAAQGVIFGNMAKVFSSQGKTDSAISLYRRAILLNATEGHDLHDMQLCMVQLSEIYLSLPDIDALKQTLDQLGQSLDTVPSLDVRQQYEKLVYRYYEEKKEPARAFVHLRNYIQQRDSADAQQKTMLNTDITKEIKDRQQEFEITLLQKENEIKKNYLMGLLIFSGMTILILVLIFLQYRNSRKNLKKLKEFNEAISRQKQELETTMQQLEEANQEKDRILRVVAHDLRNPIGGIQSLSKLMLDMQLVSGESESYLQIISNASSSASGLIYELLNNGDIDFNINQKQVTDIGQLLKSARQLSNSAALDKKQELALVLTEEQVLIETYPAQLERVLNNLIANAIKFSPTGAVTSISLIAEKEGVRISVCDQGIGIAEKDLPRIFDRFSSVKRKGTAGEKSFGLGLSICRKIIEMMGGRIWAESEMGKGSCFHIMLPR